eukprot:TRINITY_DN41980_c0_g1_i1.p1 TRINITY_DN41980_c0_g1~~TRINITY_DN41980_c0_g1_i1.p1  ORF type:complete len:784 (+),score=184.67 TRINITY_DN41980_c0_g1_i1:69-2420(+)
MMASLAFQQRDGIGEGGSTQHCTQELSSGSRDDRSLASGSTMQTGVPYSRHMEHGHAEGTSATKGSHGCPEDTKEQMCISSDTHTNSKTYSMSDLTSMPSASLLSQHEGACSLAEQVDEARGQISRKVDQVAQIQEKEIEKLKHKIAKTRQRALHAERRRDELKAAVAAKDELLKQQDAALKQSLAAASAVEDELIEAQVVQAKVELEVLHEEKNNEAGVELLQCQLAQARDALVEVKLAAEEISSTDRVLEIVEEQIRNVAEMAIPQPNLRDIQTGCNSLSGSSSRPLLGLAPGTPHTVLPTIDEDDHDGIHMDNVAFDAQTRFAQGMRIDSDVGEAGMKAGVLNKLEGRENEAKLIVIQAQLEKERLGNRCIQQETDGLRRETAEKQAEIASLRKKVDFFYDANLEEAQRKDDMGNELMIEMLAGADKAALLIEKDIELAEAAHLELMEKQVAEVTKDSLPDVNMRLDSLRLELARTTLDHEERIFMLKQEIENVTAGNINSRGNDDSLSSLSYYKSLAEELQGEIALWKDKISATEVESRIRLEENKNHCDAQAFQAQLRCKDDMAILKAECQRATSSEPQVVCKQQSQTDDSSSHKSTMETFKSKLHSYFHGLQAQLAINPWLEHIQDKPDKSCQELLWGLLNTMGHLVVLACHTSNLLVQQMSSEARHLLGEGLLGEMIFPRMTSPSHAAMARRSMISRSVGELTEIMSWCQLGSFQFTGAGDESFWAAMTSLHFRSDFAHDAQDMVFIILIPELARSDESAAQHQKRAVGKEKYHGR